MKRIDIDVFLKRAENIPPYVNRAEHFRGLSTGIDAKHSLQRKRGDGARILPPVEQVDLRDILADLIEHQFRCTYGYSCETPPRNEHGRNQWKVHYALFPPDRITAIQRSKRDHMAALDTDLTSLLSLAFWRIQIFRNEYRSGGAVVPDAFAITISLSGRWPIVDEDGNYLLQWEDPKKKGPTGRKIPMRSAAVLRLINGTLVLEEPTA